jgi:hypothetical protein
MKYFETDRGRKLLLNTLQAIIETFMEPAEQAIEEMEEKVANDDDCDPDPAGVGRDRKDDDPWHVGD